jgi:hypothetical protein
MRSDRVTTAILIASVGSSLAGALALRRLARRRQAPDVP